MQAARLSHDAHVGNHIVVGNGSQVSGDTTIEDHAVLCSCVLMQPHTRVGQWAFVQGGCSFNKDIPPYIIAAQNPTVYHGINKIVLSMGTNYAKTVFIISDNTEKIGKFITEELERGATVLDAKGFYSKESRPMIMTVIPNQDISRLTRAVHEADPKAFLIIHEAFHVLGEGYTPIEQIASSGDVTQR